MSGASLFGPEEIPVLFPTLRDAGYQRCEHPRVEKLECQDCGAIQHGTSFVGGHLEFKRRPHRYSRRDRA